MSDQKSALSAARKEADRFQQNQKLHGVNEVFTEWIWTNDVTEKGNLALRMVLSETPTLLLEAVERVTKKWVAGCRSTQNGWAVLADEREDMYMGYWSWYIGSMLSQAGQLRYFPEDFVGRIFTVLLEILEGILSCYIDIDGRPVIPVRGRAKYFFIPPFNAVHAFFTASPEICDQTFKEKLNSHGTRLIWRLMVLGEQALGDGKDDSPMFYSQCVFFGLLFGVTLPRFKLSSPIFCQLAQIQDPRERCVRIGNIDIEGGTQFPNPGKIYRDLKDVLSVCIGCAKSEKGNQARKRFASCSLCAAASYCSTACQKQGEISPCQACFV